MKQSAFHLPKINYTEIYRTPSKNFCTKYIFFNIPKLVFYFYILKIIAPELFIMLHFFGRTEPKLRQKNFFSLTLILLTGDILSTNYYNSPNHP